jgi:argininosuccinate synthase
MQNSRALVLAFSGGLDTSYCVPWLTGAGWTVHTVYVDTGGATDADRLAIGHQARAVGAASHRSVDARQ